MLFDIQVAHSVAEIGQETWDSLSGGRPFSSFRWYQYGEKVMSANLPIYVVLSIGGEAVARATFWLIHNEPLPLPQPVRAPCQLVIRRWPLMICRSPLADMSGLTIPESPLRDEALATIMRIAHEQAQHYRASFTIADYLEHQEVEWAGWPKDFIPFEFSDPGTCLTVEWPDFDGYLKHLRKSARADYRRHCRFANELGIQVTQSRPPIAGTPEFDRAMTLITNVRKRHRSPPSPWVRGTLQHIDMINHTWVTAEKDGRMVGCGILLADGTYRLFRLIGLDYGVKYAYFQLFYERIRCAIEQGARFVWGGSGAYQFKQHIGFQIMNRQYSVFAPTTSMFQVLAQRMASWVR